MTVSERADAIEVDTGAARFVFSKEGFGLPSAAWADLDGDGDAETQIIAEGSEFVCEVEHEPPGAPQEENWLRDAAGSERERFVDVCRQCHSPSFVAANFENADKMVKEADKLFAEAIEIVCPP